MLSRIFKIQMKCNMEVKVLGVRPVSNVYVLYQLSQRIQTFPQHESHFLCHECKCYIVLSYLRSKTHILQQWHHNYVNDDLMANIPVQCRVKQIVILFYQHNCFFKQSFEHVQQSNRGDWLKCERMFSFENAKFLDFLKKFNLEIFLSFQLASNHYIEIV